MTHGYSRPWLIAALVASVLLVLAAPMIGLLSGMLRDIAGGRYAAALGAIVGAAAVAAFGAAVLRIRDRRAERYAWIAAAAVVAVGYGLASRSGVPDVDAAERFHFVEYGFVAVLLYKAWLPSSDGAVLLIPLLGGFIVGTLEEWLQWFVPARVGEARDVLLNLFAVGSGLLFAIGLDPPGRVTFGLQGRSRRYVAALASFAILAFAGFFYSVHMGHEIADREAGVFRSRYSASQLIEIGESRAAQWKIAPPLTWSRFSREDQYLTEGVAHVRRRNEQWTHGNLLAARHENLILEKYYAPVLDTPSYISEHGHRWPVAQRAEAHAQTGPGFMIYDSDALTYPVFTWPRWLYWTVVGVAVAGVVRRTLGGRRLQRRDVRRASASVR
jgi:hypothetical protein